MRLAVALAVAVAVSGVSAQRREPEVVLVPSLLDVLATDARGRAVDNLTAADFTVTEGNTPLTIESVRFVRTNGSADPAATTGEADDEARARGDARLFGIFLDEFHVSPGPRADRARDALVHFVRDDLGPHDLIVVVKPLDPLLNLHFDTDRNASIRAIESFTPRQGDFTPRTTFEQNFIAGSPTRIAAARAQIATAAMNALAVHLGRFAPPRKTLVVLSEGFARAGSRRGEEVLPGLDAVVQMANRGRVAIYALDPVGDPSPATSGSASASSDASAGIRERWLRLAADTDGRFSSASEDPSAALTQLLQEASGYYVLSVMPGSANPDGRWHPVSVASRRKGITLRARSGYWSPSVEERRPAAPLTTALTTATSRLVPRRSSPLIRPWFGVLPTTDGKPQVQFVWEPAPAVPGERGPRRIPARLRMSVTTLDDVPVFDGVVLPTTNGWSAGGSEQPQTRAAFNSPPGRLLVQMTIEDSASRVIDRDVRDLQVNPFRGPINLGTPEVLRAHSARERAAIADNPGAVPVAGRQFSRAEELLIRIPVYTTGETPTVTARLTSALGGAMRDLAVAPVSARNGVYQVDLALSSLPAGDYSVDIAAQTTQGAVRDNVTFHVTP